MNGGRPHGVRQRPGPGSEVILENRRGVDGEAALAALREIVGPIEAEPSAGDQAAA